MIVVPLNPEHSREYLDIVGFHDPMRDVPFSPEPLTRPLD